MAAVGAKVFVSTSGTSAWRFQTEGTREEVLTWLAYTQHDKKSLIRLRASFRAKREVLTEAIPTTW